MTVLCVICLKEPAVVVQMRPNIEGGLVASRHCSLCHRRLLKWRMDDGTGRKNLSSLAIESEINATGRTRKRMVLG